MSIIASNVHIVKRLSAIELLPYYDDSPTKSLPYSYSDGDSYISGLLSCLADCLKEVLGDSNVTTGLYATGSSYNVVFGGSLIANFVNFRLLIGVSYNSSDAVHYTSIGITYDTPTYTTYTNSNRSFGNHIVNTRWLTGFRFNGNSKCQLIKDSVNDNYYLLIAGDSTSSKPATLGFAIGKFGVENQILLIPMYNTSTTVSNYNPDAGSFASNCVSIETTSAGVVTHLNSVYPAYLFSSATTNGAVSGSSSTATRYVSGMCVWDLNASANDKLDAVTLFTVIPSSMIGRISTYQTIPEGTMFNDYNYIVVAGSNMVIPWTGSPDTPFITSY